MTQQWTITILRYIVLSRCVVDMLHHLTGQHIPGIPRCHTFSNDIAQRTHQLLQQHEAMLAFLRLALLSYLEFYGISGIAFHLRSLLN